MLRISLVAFGIYISTLAGFSQTSPDSSYQSRKLKLEEVNFVSSYYKQEGNNSAVTGGTGSEHLTDFATTIDVRLSNYDSKRRKRTWIGEVGIDVYTSASSDKIDPTTVSSASSSDRRFYPSITHSILNEARGSTTTMTASISSEYDYFSTGFALGWSKLSKDRNREFAVKGQAFFDTWTVILPIELRSSTELKGTKPRDSYSTSLTLSQVVNKRLQILFLVDFAFQAGQLATLYHRTYFTDGSHVVERLPDSRIKVPVGVRLHYFAGDNFILRAYYRYYKDSWGLSAHNVEIEVPVKITPFFSLSPFYRYYSQNGVRYFAPYGEHQADEEFYTSDYDLSTLRSNMYGASLRVAPPGGVLGVKRLNSLEFRYGHYDRSTGLTADIVTLLAKIK